MRESPFGARTGDVPFSRGALVLFPGALGDFVCFLPALERIRSRNSGLLVLLCKGDLALLARATGIAEAEPIEDRRASWLFSPAPPPEADGFFGGFSAVESFTGKGVPEVERNLDRWRGNRGRAHLFRPLEPMHLARHFLRCIAPEEDWLELPEPRLSLSERPAALRALGMGRTGRPPLIVHPGSGGRAKRWSRAGFAEVARRAAGRGRDVVVLLGPAEAVEAEEWRKPGIRVVVGLDLVAVAALLAASDGYLGNDSGVSHLAGALGARGVVLFGPTDPQYWRPLSRRIRSLRVAPWHGYEEATPVATVDAVDHALVW